MESKFGLERFTNGLLDLLTIGFMVDLVGSRCTFWSRRRAEAR